mmetsp:Transcript_5682/g.14170  ORF Transcript_5682/g.14170 Transcript_5682/m.14170 type:complete len:286 (+) Transcript_5682:3855-4712(+)
MKLLRLRLYFGSRPPAAGLCRHARGQTTASSRRGPGGPRPVRAPCWSCPACSRLKTVLPPAQQGSLVTADQHAPRVATRYPASRAPAPGRRRCRETRWRPETLPWFPPSRTSSSARARAARRARPWRRSWPRSESGRGRRRWSRLRSPPSLWRTGLRLLAAPARPPHHVPGRRRRPCRRPPRLAERPSRRLLRRRWDCGCPAGDSSAWLDPPLPPCLCSRQHPFPRGRPRKARLATQACWPLGPLASFFDSARQLRLIIPWPFLLLRALMARLYCQALDSSLPYQ